VLTQTAIDEVLRRGVERGDTFGVVGVATDAAGNITTATAGSRRADADEPMSLDSIFRIASMTKLVTSVAAVQLCERGELDLDAPVPSIVPSWADLKVLEGFDGDEPRLREARTTATVRQLLTHTAGLSYWIWNADTDRYETLTGQPNVGSGLRACFTNPLVRDPGTGFEYSMATDWVGYVVETVSGQPLDRYFREHIFDPLGMADTDVKPDDEQLSRMVPVHARTEDGFVELGFNWNLDAEFWAGGHCLFSTPLDYLRLQRALLGNGVVDRTRILESKTVEEMFTNQIGDLEFTPLPLVRGELSVAVDLGPGQKWGLGVRLTPDQRPGLRAPGTGDWGGIFNTYFWIDHARGVAGAIYMQFLPFFDDRAVDLYARFERAVYGS
jgi:CubicO group peptidase (beta-lactamase class C family)